MPVNEAGFRFSNAYFGGGTPTTEPDPDSEPEPIDTEPIETGTLAPEPVEPEEQLR